jgi:hypothetical protein
MRALAAVLARRALAGQGWDAGAASVKRHAARANRYSHGLYAEKMASLCRRSFGLPKALAPAHNFLD